MADNIYTKLLNIRKSVRELGLKQSGKNFHAEYEYYELKDIIPVAEEVLADNKTMFVCNFDGNAKGTLVDLENPESKIEFTFAPRPISEPAKFRMNETQALGAELTYMRRYLWFLLLDITAPDEFDKTVIKENKQKPAEPVKRQEAKTALVGADDPANEMQIRALKGLLSVWLKSDPSAKSQIESLALETKNFTTLTKTQCENTISQIKGLINKDNTIS